MATIYGTNNDFQVPSLDLRFADRKNLVDTISGRNLITFSRNSIGTYVDENGVIQSAATNEARFDHDPVTGESLGLLVEESRTNSSAYSEYGGSILNIQRVFIVNNTEIAPNGTFTASKLVSDTQAGQKIANYDGSKKTISFFAKAAEVTVATVFGFVSGVGARSANFDLINGTVTSLVGGVVATITPFANGWYRCSAYSSDGWGTYNSIRLPDNQTANTGFYLWGIQLEDAAFPTSYIPTPATFTSRASTATYYDANGVIQTAAIDVARDDAYFPDENGVMQPAGLLLEESGTNLILYSEELDNTSKWTRTGLSTVSADSAVAPDGTSTADKLVEDTSTGTHRLRTAAISTSPDTRYSYSVYAKAAERSDLFMSLGASTAWGGIGISAKFDLNTGTVIDITDSSTAYATAEIQALPNGWYRCIFSATRNSNSAASFNYIGIYDAVGETSSYTGDGSSGIYLWGAQFEVSPYPTSYIPTTSSTVTRAADVSSSSTVTRAADVASITGSNFSSWYNQSEGTVFVDLPTNLNSVGQNDVLFSFHNGSANRVLLQWVTTSWSWKAAGNQVAINPYVSYDSTAGKYAFSFDSNNIAATYNGQTTNTVTSSSLVQDVTDLRFFTEWNGGRAVDGHISRLTYYPTRLSNALLQKLTK